MFTLVLLAYGEWVGRRKCERWAQRQGFQLLECKGVPIWRGPRAWRRRKNEKDYEIVVQDATGKCRRGWLLFTRPWHTLGPQRVEVLWEESL